MDRRRQVTLQTLVGELAHLGTLLLHILVNRLALAKRQDIKGIWALSLLHNNLAVLDLADFEVRSDYCQGVGT